MSEINNKLFSYTTNLLMQFFEKRGINSGDRLFALFQKEKEVKGQYDALRETKAFDVVDWGWPDGDYQSYCIDINGINLIVAAAVDGVHEDFLTGLRNKIDSDAFQFKEHAILFLLHKPLDSLISGSDDLSKGGMPLHLDEISKSIAKDIEVNSSLKWHENAILNYTLKQKANNLFIKNRSLFDLGIFLNILGAEQIASDSYEKLGMFPDPEFKTVSKSAKKIIQKRMDQNTDWFDKIQSGHQYGHVLSYLEKTFSEKGIEALKDPATWMTNKFENLAKWAAEKSAQQGVEYLEEFINQTNEGLNFWDKGDGDSAAKSRRRNICIFNPEKKEACEFDLKFNGTILKKGLRDGRKAKLSCSGKKLTASIEIETPEEVSYYNFKYDDPNSNHKFNFSIVILPFEEGLLSEIKTCYLVRSTGSNKVIEINPDEDIIDFNDVGRGKKEFPLEIDETYELEGDCQLKLNTDGIELSEGETEVNFFLKYDNISVPMRYVFDLAKPVFISGNEVWLQKRQSGTDFLASIYIDSKKREVISLEHGTKRFYVQNDFRDNIKRENLIVNAGGLCWNELEPGNIIEDEISIPDDIKSAYLAIIEYYQGNNKLLPSTAFLNDELSRLYNLFTDALISFLQSVPRESLKDEAKGLAKLGTLNILYGEKLTLFTPLHPVNIAYQLLANEMLADEEVPRQIAERLGATNIVPYLKKSKSELYAPIGQTHSPEWIYYSNTGRGSQTISKNFVPYLIKEKLNEFTQHFTQLFQDSRRPIRVNLINMGNCSEALSGIFQYYQDRLLTDKNVTVDEILPMVVHIYSKNKQATKFEELSQYTDTDIIENEFNINLHRNKDYDPEIWLELFHQKVHFYSSEITDNAYEYAHISFFQFDSSRAQMSNYDIDKVPSGLSLGGLMSDMSSVSENNNYRSCFGFKGEIEELNKLTKVARNINPLLHVAGTDDIYDREQTTATVINANVRADLEGIYNSSQWVTFIDPKVDLSFFKESKDVVIIHYSDQYNNASGYDAITVTKKCKQYQQALKLLLQKYDVMAEEDEVNKVIDIFNAINGDWLLKLNSQKSRGSFQDEKISILSAAKAGLALLDTPEITWIPISLEEILRVSGGVGLSQKEGLFSAKNLGEAGKTSDDILFIGLEQCNDEIKLHMFPVEVKVGAVNSKTVKDAKKQALHTTKILREKLQDDSFSAKIYRNFFAKIALVNASKLSLYNVWPEYNVRWDRIKDIQQQLLNDKFTLDWSLDNKIGKAGVFSFKASTDYGARSIVRNNENIYHVELFEPDSAKFLKNSVESVKTDLANLIGTFYPAQGDVTHPVSPETTEVTPSVVETEPGIEPNETIDASEEGDIAPVDPPVPTEPLSILFGHHANLETPIKWHPTDTDLVMHTNTGIIGTMGTGKTQFTKSLVAQLSWNSHNNVNSKPLGILIFDYKGDYIKDDFMQATGAKRLDLHHLPYNPLAIISSDNSPPMLPLHTANNICQSIRTAFNLGIKQRQKLRDCIMAAYSLHGIDKSNKQSWSKPAPTISDVCEIYLNDEEVKEDSLYAAISNLHEFEIFEPDSSKTKSLYDLIDGVTVINLSGYDSDIQNLIVAITLDLFYTQMQRNGHSVIDGKYRQLSKFILVDEADNFLSKNFESIKKIMKEGREFGVGTILSTQFLNHFSTGENEYSNYILTWIIHRVNEIKAKEVESLFNIMDRNQREELMAGIKSLEKHYSIVTLAGQQPVKMKDKAFWELNREDISCQTK